jgi:hypothetical protein
MIQTIIQYLVLFKWLRNYQRCGCALFFSNKIQNSELKRKNEQLATNMLVVRRVSTAAVAVVPKMLVVPTRTIVTARNFSNVSNVISPKSEYSGRSEVLVEHEITVKKDVLSRVQHDVAPGAEDAPWTPKSQIGKTPMVSLCNLMKVIDGN